MADHMQQGGIDTDIVTQNAAQLIPGVTAPTLWMLESGCVATDIVDLSAFIAAQLAATIVLPCTYKFA